jgi:hypothetical protein
LRGTPVLNDSMATRFGTECISAGPYLKIERFNT